MNSPILQLVVLAGIAIFLILRLRSVLGTRDGFEAPPEPKRMGQTGPKRDFEVIEGGPDRDITDHVPEDSPAAGALAKMKAEEPSFSVTEFLAGARGAYEMILMGFETGDLAPIKPFLADDVYEAFAGVVEAREKQGLTVEADRAVLHQALEPVTKADHAHLVGVDGGFANAADGRVQAGGVAARGEDADMHVTDLSFGRIHRS